MTARTRKDNVRLRAAVPDDCRLLRTWSEKPHVIAADSGDDWNWEEELLVDHDWRQQLIAEAGGRPVGFIQIIDPAEEISHYWGDVPPNLRAVDLWIGNEDELRRGLGTEMMSLVLSRCFENPDVEAVLVDPLASNSGAHKFYQAMGFKVEGFRWLGKDYCLVHRLDRVAWSLRSGG